MCASCSAPAWRMPGRFRTVPPSARVACSSRNCATSAGRACSNRPSASSSTVADATTCRGPPATTIV
eukprot:7590281-Prorocentrum_lima.AAC.1